jgi:hypothetical protein
LDELKSFGIDLEKDNYYDWNELYDDDSDEGVADYDTYFDNDTDEEDEDDNDDNDDNEKKRNPKIIMK